MDLSANPMSAANALNGSLVVPAQDNLLLVIRLTLSGIASVYGFDVDAVDDIRDAATEAAHMLIRKVPEGAKLSIIFQMKQDILCVDLCVETNVEFLGNMDEVCLCILRSLVDKVETHKNGIRLLKRKI